MNKRVEKPWGWYQVLTEGPDYVTKELFVVLFVLSEL